jgi:hypothetical protein
VSAMAGRLANALSRARYRWRTGGSTKFTHNKIYDLHVAIG